MADYCAPRGQTFEDLLRCAAGLMRDVVIDRRIEPQCIQKLGGLTVGFIAFDLLVVVGHEFVVLQDREVVYRQVFARHFLGAAGVVVAIAEVEQQRRRRLAPVLTRIGSAVDLEVGQVLIHRELHEAHHARAECTDNLCRLRRHRDGVQSIARAL